MIQLQCIHEAPDRRVGASITKLGGAGGGFKGVFSSKKGGEHFFFKPPTFVPFKYVSTGMPNHTMHECMSLTLSNKLITIKVRRSGSHFLGDIQSKNGLNADRLNADI